MNLNYEKIKSKFEQGGHQWTSYSDLFLVLSVTFLLLFVVANLRNSTSSIMQGQALSAAKQDAEALRKQLKAYEVLKDDYLQKGATQDEVQVYNDLIGKLSLLEGEAKEKSDELSKQSKELKEKQNALNHYQQLVQNIVNANLISSGKIKNRNAIIQGQDKELESLDQTVKTKQGEIERNNQLIAQAQQELVAKAQRLKDAQRTNAKNRAKYEQEFAALEAQNTQKISALKAANDQTYRELDNTKSQLDAKNREAEQLVATLSSKENEFKNNINSLVQENEGRIARERAQFETELQKSRLNAAAKLERERQFRAAAELQKAAFESRLGKLNSDLQATQNELREAGGRYQGPIKALQKTNETLSRDLAESIEKLNEQRKLADRIKKNFTNAGLNAAVDPKTGDVSIEFAPEYFDSGRAELKPNMRKILQETIPVYANSLFQDTKVSKRLGSVEIIGFASPTFRGKEVDPQSLSTEDRIAVNYNMDLSYRRAKTIFEHIFNPNQLQFEHQKTLLPLVKVSGRSYLGNADGSQSRSTASVGQEGYCKTHDCRKNQIVIIKFNLKESAK